MRKRQYSGCEWNSPIYRQIVAEQMSKGNSKESKETKTKRGKRA